MKSPSEREALVENRRFPRVSASCGLRFTPVSESDVAARLDSMSEAMMRNISGGGICFVSERPLTPGCMLALELRLPGFPMDVISMGKVAWSRPLEDDAPGFEIGLEFWWIGWEDEEAQTRIRGFIAETLKDSTRPR